ncbi:MAG TPA: hypothetical protein VF918_05175 [Anaerolineales bacterium]
MKSAVDWKLGLWWSLATLGGLILGLVILFAGLGVAINNFPPFLFGLVIGCTFGLGCAAMQWLALRRLVSAWWIAATFAAWAIFWAINLAGFLGNGSGVLGKVIEGLGHGALFGALVGFFQWLVLRSKTHNANWWIYANILGWSIGAALGDGIKAALGSEDPIEFVIVFIVSTIVTAIVLVRMFRNEIV